MLHPNNKLNQVSLNNTFAEMGMNSLDIMEIMQQISVEYDIYIESKDIEKFKNVYDIV